VDHFKALSTFSSNTDNFFFIIIIIHKMGSSQRLFNRERTLHEILGGGQGKYHFLIVYFLLNISTLFI
jgi:hypothetical protein